MASSKDRNRELSVDEIYSAYHAALTQAESLLDESHLLAANDKHGGAVHRLVICLEEVGKARLLFYQGAFIATGEPGVWPHFWRSFYSHVDKLEQALLLYTRFPLDAGSTSAEVESALSWMRNYARSLDEKKQTSSYSCSGGEVFDVPSHDRFEADATILLTIAEDVLGMCRSHPATAGTRDEFVEALLVAARYARALGYLNPTGRDEMLEAIAQGGGDVRLLREELPSEEDFMARVAERYGTIPPRLCVTLPQLRQSPEFLNFYSQLHTRNGYPDWVIICVLLNLSLNARVQLEQAADADALAQLANWTEDATIHEPLEVGTFTNPERFEETLDLWLVPFMASLGILPEAPDARRMGVRRVAARWFGIFDRDVPHAPLFPSSGD